MALHLRGQELGLRDIAARLVITRGKNKGQHPSPATVLRMLRGHGDNAAAAAGGGQLCSRRSLVIVGVGVGVPQLPEGAGGQVGKHGQPRTGRAGGVSRLDVCRRVERASPGAPAGSGASRAGRGAGRTVARWVRRRSGRA